MASNRSSGFAALAVALSVSAALITPALAEGGKGFLEGIKRHTTLASTVPDNGDQNPYAIVVAPVSAGMVQKDDVLVTNFNDSKNLQGLGTTIIGYRPATKSTYTFAKLPRTLAQCPGGVGLTTAMTMLKSGWVIVGSAPSSDGTTATSGPGCMMVLDPQGKLSGVLAGAMIDMPWGNMATIDDGTTATLFVSNAGIGGAGGDKPDATTKASVLRIALSIPAGKPPVVTGQTVIGSGFGAMPDKDVFLIGPTGLALASNGTLYVSDAVGNRVTAIADAATRTDSAGIGAEVSQGGLLHRPLAMTLAPNGHLLVINGLNGQVVEIDPVAGKQIYARWIDPNKAQSPPGSGDLFGIAMTPAGDGFYFVEDEVNTLVLAH